MKTLCIVTRCHPSRPNMLKICTDSIKRQTCDDYSHLLLKDPTEKGYGVDEANEAIRKLSIVEVNGHYVMVLDDDDMLIDDDFIKEFVIAVKDNPDVVIFRGIVGNHGLLPPNNLWKHPPVRGRIGSFCFAVSKEYWEAYRNYWSPSEGYPAMCDFTFINACYNNAQKVVWLDRIVAVTQRGANRGKGE